MTKKCCQTHYFEDSQVKGFQDALLDWYEGNKRTLPWRTLALEEKDPNRRGYAVWVSEIMLQQTQVATVIEYYNKWMAKWPTMEDLAKATLDEVNQAWAGLGYYSRGKRLWEGAQKIVNEYDGQLPTTSQQLEKVLPGVGKYTASAIASIAFNEAVGVVDGNVMRVLARLRVIGGDVSSNDTIAAFWTNANHLVDKERPGAFNQGMMELGAKICTPKNPQCSSCPVETYCKAKKAKDIEDLFKPQCPLCLPKDTEWNGVLTFPRKAKKTKVTSKTTLVCILSHEGQICWLQRPKTGLLAGLYELPSMECTEEGEALKAKDVKQKLQLHFGINTIDGLQDHGDVMHQFSHISQKYLIWSGNIKAKNELQVTKGQKFEWVNDDELESLAISTAMKKVFAHYKGQNPKKRKAMSEKNQRSIKQFFVKK